MSPVPALLAQLLHAALMLAAAPGLVGLMRWVGARLRGGTGPHPVQPFRDLFRALRRQTLVPEGASPVFAAAPVLCFSFIAAAAMLVPSFALGMASAPLSDLLVIAGLLSLAGCPLVLAAMDSGTALGGLGASRATATATLAAPAWLLVILTVAALTGTTNLDAAAGFFSRESSPRAACGLALIATIAVAIVETGRVPVGDPAAPSELGMVHHALALAFSGWHLAVIEAAASLRLLVWLSLIAAIFLPFGMAPAAAGPLAWAVGALAWVAKMLVLATALVATETVLCRMRLARVAEFAAVAMLVALIAALLAFAGQGAA